MMSAAYASAPSDTEQAAGDSQDEPFAEEQPPHLSRAEPDGAKQADFAHPLLDTKLEEQRREHQRRDHQEEAEVDEVFAEVRGAA